MCLTEKSYVGLVPWIAVPGDVVCIFPGCAVPFVIRRIDKDFRMVGECYLHGIMNGEVGKMEAMEVRSIKVVQRLYISCSQKNIMFLERRKPRLSLKLLDRRRKVDL